METNPADPHPELLFGMTTVESLEDAESLARKSVESGLIVCAQIDGPIRSFYKWEGVLENTAEYRLTLKFLASGHREVETWLMSSHPYDTPEWAVFSPRNISEKYLHWAKKTSNRLSF